MKKMPSLPDSKNMTREFLKTNRAKIRTLSWKAEKTAADRERLGHLNVMRQILLKALQ